MAKDFSRYLFAGLSRLQRLFPLCLDRGAFYGALFCLCVYYGQAALPKKILQDGSWTTLARAMPLTSAIQFFVVSALYLMGRGAGSFFFSETEAARMPKNSTWTVIAFAIAYVLLANLLLARISKAAANMDGLARSSSTGMKKEVQVDEATNALLTKAFIMSEEAVHMPVEIFKLAREFADLPHKEATLAITSELLQKDKNHHVRRVFYTMIRFMGQSGLRQNDELAEILLSGLKDPAAWVRYDAAWVIETQQVRNESIIRRLEELARGYAENDEMSPSDAEANAKKRAYKALQALNADE